MLESPVTTSAALELQAVQALVRKYDDAYLQNEDGADREFWVAFFSLPTSQPLRALKTGAIGHLTCFKVRRWSLCELS